MGNLDPRVWFGGEKKEMQADTMKRCDCESIICILRVLGKDRLIASNFFLFCVLYIVR